MANFTVTQPSGPLVPKFGDYTSGPVAKFESPHGVPEALEHTIDTLGYRELRLFARVFITNYQHTPIDTAKARLTIHLFHGGGGASSGYASKVLTTRVTSYIDGYLAAPILGSSTRFILLPEHLPDGPYLIGVTYYLLP